VSKERKICLFAGFDQTNAIQDYVVYYLKELSKLADIYYLADCPMPQKELDKLSGITKGAYAFRHGKYDFGSWQELIKRVTWEEIGKYDQLIFANDSCYGPIFPFQDMFVKMESQNVDFWGITKNTAFNFHLQSYFLVFTKKIFCSEKFRLFIDGVAQQKTFLDVVRTYEVRLTQMLIEEGFSVGVYADESGNRNLALYPLRSMAMYRVPLIKVKCFLPKFNHFKEWYPSLKKMIKTRTTYDYGYIEKHLISKGINLYENEVLLWFQQPVLRWIYRAKVTKNGRKIVKIFGVPIYIGK
jgi:lipopolysaccharide biosynthesis protein